MEIVSSKLFLQELISFNMSFGGKRLENMLKIKTKIFVWKHMLHHENTIKLDVWEIIDICTIHYKNRPSTLFCIIAPCEILLLPKMKDFLQGHFFLLESVTSSNTWLNYWKALRKNEFQVFFRWWLFFFFFTIYIVTMWEFSS